MRGAPRSSERRVDIARNVLVVDDEPLASSALARRLSSSGFSVVCVENAQDAIDELTRAHYHAALVDVSLSDDSGHSVLAFASSVPDPPAVLMMSSRPDVATVVACMRAGASDFVDTTSDDFDDIKRRIETCISTISRRRKLEAYEAQERLSVLPSKPATRAMAEVLRLADKVAETPASGALLVGESGVGKEVISTRIHQRSRRSAGPFVRVNVAAIPASIFEAELFGSIKGAFTDAKATRTGYLASADGGTILLDEIGELRADVQPKLLRVLEERRFFPIGSDRPRSVDVRVIAATNRDPEQVIRDGLLRSDLFYRLGAVIRIPPLRERVNEIVPLASHFVSSFCRELGRADCRLSAPAVALLESYRWPGNIRQLRNAVERAVMLTEGSEIPVDAFDISEEPIGNEVIAVSEMTPLPKLRRDVTHALEREEIVKALGTSNGSRAAAARLLGLSRSTLYEKLKRYGLA